jgi:hypothetical protein
MPSCSSEKTSGDARGAPALQRAEKLLLGGLALGVGHLHGEYLAHAIVPYTRNDQNALADHSPIQPHLLVASIDEEVRVGLCLESPAPLRPELRVQGAGQLREEALGEGGPQSSCVTSLTFLVETPSTYICIKAKQSALSFRW